MPQTHATTNLAPPCPQRPALAQSLAPVVSTITWLLLLVTVAMPWFAAEAATSNNGALWRPRFATPAIVALDTAANRQFTAEVRASAAATGWSMILSNDLRAWTCQILSATYSTINRGTESGWQIKASVPADASPELFTLAVSCSELVSVQGQSVSVAPGFTNDFYILHLTDEQIVNEQHTAPSGQHYDVGSREEILWMQEPINLINPRFVLITGDQIDYNGALDGWNNWPNWGYTPSQNRLFTQQETTDIQNRLIGLYKDSHTGFRVPYVQAPGNHDVPPTSKVLSGTTIKWHPIAVPIYEAEFGQRSWSFKMADFYVLLHDWSESSLKTWANADYNAALNDASIKFRLIGQHYTNDQALYPSTCDLMLVGHGHTTATLRSSSYLIYEDGPAFSYGTSGFFNFRRTPNDWTCDQTTSARDTAKDVWRLFTDNGAVKKVRSNRPDSMNITANFITIYNDLPRNFYDGRVRFLLSKGTYAVTNGTLLAQYDCLNNTKTAVLVRVNIPASSTVTVTIGPQVTNPAPDLLLDPQAFGSRMKLSFAAYNRGEALTNFPALVTFNPATPGFSYNQFASPVGADLRFADASGTNALRHELDEWNTNGISRVWVQVPVLAGPNSSIWAYWGNPGATTPPTWTTNGSVWSQDFELTWHLKGFNDSTLRHSASSPAMPGTSAAFIGSGASFDGSSYLDCGTVDLGNAFTLSAWVNVSATATNIQTVWANKVAGWNSDGLALFINSWNTANRSVRLETGNGTDGSTASTASSVLTFGDWHLLTAVVDTTTTPQTARLYVDGVDRTQSSTVYSAFNTVGTLQLGEMLNGSSRFHGLIDEARVETQARSSNWIWASYMTTASNTTFTSYSTVSRQTPSLSLTPAPSAQILAWPANGVGFSLYTTTNLTPPVLWTQANNAAVLTNNQWQVLLPPGNAPARYYRLQSQ